MRQIKFLYIFLILVIPHLIGYPKGHEHFGITTISSNCENPIDLSNLKNAQIVYVCTGAYAYAYHSRSDCPGLGNCKGQVKYTDIFSAVNSLRRVPCCRCWSNVAGRCKDDNPYYGGGPGGRTNSDAYAYLALAIVVTSAIILSNDVYVHPAISFYNPNNYGQQSNIGVSTGWIFGFRKTFKHSALEYGASYIKSKVNYNYGYGYVNEIYRWGAHFNYVHQIFHNKTPDWLRLYFGPSINSVFDFGYGGIIGTEMKLFDRLRFDVRYEWTTQTNQIQAGLIFTYQKKYIWQRK